MKDLLFKPQLPIWLYGLIGGVSAITGGRISDAFGWPDYTNPFLTGVICFFLAIALTLLRNGVKQR